MFVRPDKICIYDALNNKKMQQQMTKSDAKNCCTLGVFYAPLTSKSNNVELHLYRAYISFFSIENNIKSYYGGFKNFPFSPAAHKSRFGYA